MTELSVSANSTNVGTDRAAIRNAQQNSTTMEVDVYLVSLMKYGTHLARTVADSAQQGRSSLKKSHSVSTALATNFGTDLTVSADCTKNTWATVYARIDAQSGSFTMDSPVKTVSHTRATILILRPVQTIVALATSTPQIRDANYVENLTMLMKASAFAVSTKDGMEPAATRNVHRGSTTLHLDVWLVNLTNTSI